MSWTKSVRAGLVLWLLFFWLGERAEAVFVDSEETLSVSARVQSRASVRLQDSDGFTQPNEIGVGDLVQWRNLALIEISHNLDDLTNQLDILYPFKALKIRSKYHIVGRFMYEAVYDVGPEAFQDVAERDHENIDDFKQAYDLWECYADLSRENAFLRIGRQNLSWGETDIFRLLDNINPLDNTFGFVFEDLDDRRIPLWMLRGSYNFGKMGPVRSFGIESFWVPGNWDARVAPLAPGGTPYAVPAPSSPLPRFVITPSKVMSNSRWGVRLTGMIADNYNFSLGHYRTFLDIPVLRLAVGDSPLDAWTEMSYSDVQITGGSLSFWQPQTNVIIRTEVAWFWDEPVFIPEINTPIVPLPFPVPGLPGLPANGSIPKKDALRWMIGLDKDVWIRALNKTNTFLLAFQWFGTWWQEYDERMRFPAANYPDATNFSSVKELENTLTMLVNTFYFKGSLQPQVACAYDPRGVWLFMPSAKYTLEPFRFGIQYSAIVGNMISSGVMRDRDQISFHITYLLN
jgi:hypothetical protein